MVITFKHRDGYSTTKPVYVVVEAIVAVIDGSLEPHCNTTLRCIGGPDINIYEKASDVLAKLAKIKPDVWSGYELKEAYSHENGW